MIEKLKHQMAGQNRHRFGVRSESLDQLNLTFEEDEAIAEAAEEQAKPAQSLRGLRSDCSIASTVTPH